MKNITVYLVSLGCPKNLVDSENLLALLGEESCVLTGSPEDADTLIVNTCGFLQSAVDESTDVIRNLCRKKKKRQRVIVYGCLVQRYGGRLPGITRVDAGFGVGTPEKIVSYIKYGGQYPCTECGGRTEASVMHADEVDKTMCADSGVHSPRLISTYPYAYIKISEGCENCCSYCLIPEIRGPLKSRGIRDICEEARGIEAMGIRELILVAQDTANYGKDLNNKTILESLLEKLFQFRLQVQSAQCFFPFCKKNFHSLLTK